MGAQPFLALNLLMVPTDLPDRGRRRHPAGRGRKGQRGRRRRGRRPFGAGPRAEVRTGRHRDGRSAIAADQGRSQAGRCPGADEADRHRSDSHRPQARPAAEAQRCRRGHRVDETVERRLPAASRSRTAFCGGNRCYRIRSARAILPRWSRRPGLRAELFAESVPLLSGAERICRCGRSAGWVAGQSEPLRAKGSNSTASIDDVLRTLLFDAQTSGGLLLADPRGAAARFPDPGGPGRLAPLADRHGSPSRRQGSECGRATGRPAGPPRRTPG